MLKFANLSSVFSQITICDNFCLFCTLPGVHSVSRWAPKPKGNLTSLKGHVKKKISIQCQLHYWGVIFLAENYDFIHSDSDSIFFINFTAVFHKLSIWIRMVISPSLGISQQFLNVCYSSPLLSPSGKLLCLLKLKKSLESEKLLRSSSILWVIL